MPRDFKMLIFYPDGGEPEVAEFAAASMSSKWSTICREILDSRGVVFRHNMGDTLSHFEIELGGPMGRLWIDEAPCFEFCLYRGVGDEQDRETLSHFEALVDASCQASQEIFSAEGRATLRTLGDQPAQLVFDCCDPEIDDDQKMAMGQLGAHLAGAYFDYCEDNA